MRVHLGALGCRLNEAELQQWGAGFSSAGHELVRRPEEAELVVLNTCAVTAEAARKSRKSIRRVQAKAPGARLVVSGCYASLEPEEVAAQLGVDLVVDNQAKDRLVDVVSQALELDVAPVAATEPDAVALFGRGRRRAFVKVQDGCRHRCTYCIVTVARGEERSRPVEHILEEIRGLVRAGVKEAVITGVHVGGYGSDLGLDLAALLGRILDETSLPRLRLASVEPWDLPPSFFELFENPRLMPHMHLPLQSGSDRVLKRMARRCRTEDFRRLVEQARRAVPGFGVTTDLIVGFPGETDEDWAQTLAFVDEVGFQHVHIFSFSPRAGTHAATLGERVPPEVKRARVRELHALAARHKRQALEARVGERATVLLECGGDERRREGYTPSYLRTWVRGVPEGQDLVDVALEGLDAEGEALLARPVA